MNNLLTSLISTINSMTQQGFKNPIIGKFEIDDDGENLPE